MALLRKMSARQKRRFKTKLKIVMLLFLLAGAISLWFYIVYNPKLLILSVQVDSSSEQKSKATTLIRNILYKDNNPFLPSENIYFFDKKTISDRIMFVMPEIKSVFFNIDNKFEYNKLKITLTKRSQEFLFCDKNDKLYKTDEDGYIYQPLNMSYNKKNSLIICTNPERTNLSTQRDYPIRFIVKNEELATVKKVKTFFKDKNITPVKINFLPESEIKVEFQEGFYLLLLANDDLSDQLENFAIAWRSKLKDLDLEYADARFDSKVYWKPREGAINGEN